MVAWNGQHGRPQAVHERARRAELGRTSALRDVARQYNHIRTLLVSQRAQGFDDRALLGAEMRVGNLQQHAQGAAPSARGRASMTAASRWGFSR